MPELHVSSPPLDGNNLELLIMAVDPFTDAVEESIPAVEESVLVPAVEIPTSSTGRYTPITAPVHKALLVGDGIKGAAAVLSFPFLENRDTIGAAVNLRKYAHEDASGFPFIKVDVQTAGEGLVLFRQDVSNAMQAGNLWDEANLGAVRDWLKSGTLSNDQGTTKEAVRNLIRSLLDNATAAIASAEAQQLSSALTAKVSTGARLRA